MVAKIRLAKKSIKEASDWEKERILQKENREKQSSIWKGGFQELQLQVKQLKNSVELLK